MKKLLLFEKYLKNFNNFGASGLKRLRTSDNKPLNNLSGIDLLIYKRDKPWKDGEHV